MGVFDIEDIGKERKAIVKNSRNCTTCRECLHHGELSDKIDLGKLKDVFEFTVESLGMYKPEEIVTQSFEVLKSKSKHWLNLLSENEK